MADDFQCFLEKEDLNEVKDLSSYECFFLFDGNGQLDLQWLNDHNYALSYLVFNVSRTPEKLIVHIQRIYHCYQLKSAEQLYAALIDFFIVLNGKGLAISRRMLNGCGTVLGKVYLENLQNYLTEGNTSVYILNNEFSVLGKGLIGNLNLVNKALESEPQVHDPLIIARDYIEYSQLDEAKEVLEVAIREQPLRGDLQLELLDIYRSTRGTLGFQEIYETVTDTPEQQAWDDLKTHFAK